MGNWVERQDWVREAGVDEYSTITSIFCRTRNEERKVLRVLPERWEGVVVFSSGGWKARKSSSDQSLEPDCHRNQSRASLPHDHTECASRANSSRVTTLTALLSYAYMLLYETSIQIMGTEGYCLVLLIQPKCDRIPVSDIKAFFLASKIWHLKEWLGYFVSLSLFSTVSSLCVTGKTASIKLWLWAGTLWSEVQFVCSRMKDIQVDWPIIIWSRDLGMCTILREHRGGTEGKRRQKRLPLELTLKDEEELAHLQEIKVAKDSPSKGNSMIHFAYKEVEWDWAAAYCLLSLAHQLGKEWRDMGRGRRSLQDKCACIVLHQWGNLFPIFQSLSDDLQSWGSFWCCGLLRWKLNFIYIHKLWKLLNIAVCRRYSKFIELNQTTLNYHIRDSL